MSIDQVRAKCMQVIELAKAAYGIDMTGIQVSFNLSGRTAGKAGGKRLRDTVMSNYYVKFNRDMLTRVAADHIINDTVPHELAHIICFIRPELGKNHDYGWASVCRKLGGTGKRTHDEDVVFGNGTTYEYTTSTGKKMRISDQKHAKVQRGHVLRYSKGFGSISITCPYSIVGRHGRTLETPIVKQAPLPSNHPTEIEKHVMHTDGGHHWSPEAIRKVLRDSIIVKTVVPAKTVAPMTQSGLSKAAMARAVMLSGHNAGKSYEEIITAIMAATGHDRQLSRSYYKGNYAKVGCPAP